MKMLAVMLLCAAPVDPQAAFLAANDAYLQGRFDQAAEGYARLVAGGHASADVHYNLGNASFSQGKLGQAILEYERALRLDPDDDDARANLDKARRELVDKVSGQAGEPLVDRVSSLASPVTTGWLFLAAYLLFTLALLARRFLRLGARSLIAAAAGLLVAIPSGALLGVQAYREQLHEAVVVGRTVPVREGPSSASKASFELHEGTSVRILDRDGDFVRVRLGNGLEGWAEDGGVAEI